MRAWICCHCGAVHDRDVNAARNILALGREGLAEESSSKLRSNLVGEDVNSLGSQNGRATRYPNGDPSTSAINANPSAAPSGRPTSRCVGTSHSPGLRRISRPPCSWMTRWLK